MGTSSDEDDNQGIDAIYSRVILTQDQCAAIGCVAVESSRLEVVFESLLWYLLGLDRARGIVVTSRFQFKTKIELFKELVKLKDEKAGDAFQGLFVDINNAIAKRRVVIHGHWELDTPDMRLYLRALARRDGSVPAVATLKQQKILGSEVLAIAHEFSKLHSRLDLFLQQHADTLR